MITPQNFASVFIYRELFAAVREHRHHALEVVFGNECVNIELTFTFRGLLGQNVARVRMTAFDLTRGGRAKSLRGALMCFEFWHNSSIKIANSGQWAVGSGQWAATAHYPLPTTNYFSFFGVKITVICMPSSRGLNSGAPLSARSFSSLSSN